MKTVFRSSLFISLLFWSATLCGSLARHSTSVAAVSGADIVIDSSGNVYHMVHVESEHKFIITKSDDQGDLVTAFGTNGVLTLTIANSASASTGTTINVSNFSQIRSGEKSFLRIDNSGKIVIGTIIMTTSGSLAPLALTIRLNSTTGALDSTYNSDGVAIKNFGNASTYGLGDMAIDSSDRIILLMRKGGLLAVVRFTDSSSVLEFVSDSVIDDHVGYAKLYIDGSDNIIIAGKYGASSGSYGLFCTRLDASDFDTSLAFTISTSGNLGLNDDSPVFIVDPAVTNKLDVYAVASNGVDLIRERVTISVGQSSGNTTYSSVFSSAVSLKSMYYTGSKFYFAGTINSGGQTTFIGRTSSSFVGDTTFAASGDDNYIANGFVKIPVTSGSTVASGEGGYFAYSAGSPSTVSVGFAETDGSSNKSFVRVFGAEASHFLEGPVVAVVPSSSVESVSNVDGRANKDKAFSYVTLSGTNVTSIDDGNVMVTSYDDVVAFFRTGAQFVFSVVNEQGALETDFGTSGSVTIEMKSSGASTAVAAITNFSAVTSGKKSHLAYDNLNNILLASQVDISGGTKQVVLLRIKNGVASDSSGAGELDTTFSSDGVATLTASSDTHQVEGVVCDSQGRALVLVYHDDGSGTTTGHVYRFTSVGVLDATFGTSGKTDLSASSFLENAQAGMSLQVDYQDNVYIAGQYLDSGNRGLFCVKVKESDGAIDSSNFATSGTAGLFESAALSELDGSNMQTFISIYEYDDIQNIQIVTRGTSGGNSGVVIQQINILDGTADASFGSSGKQFSEIDNLTTLNSAGRNEDGHLFCGGTVTESSVVKTFLARFTESGLLDGSFGDSSGPIQTGIAKLDATDTWTITDGGYLFLDSGGAIPIAHVESKGASRQLVVQRVPGNDDLDFDVGSVDNGANLKGFVLTNHLNSVSGLSGLIHLDGIASELQADWEAVGGVLDAATITKGVNLFREAVGVVLGFFVNRASLNSFGSCLALSNKTGPMNKKMHKLINKVENSFSTAQLSAMDPGINVAFEKLFSRLNNGRKGATDKIRKSKKTQ